MNVSVVIVTLNRAESLKRCLSSFTRQERKPYEVIIVDNGSTDDTKTAAMSYKHVLPLNYVFEKEKDVSAARNTGIKAATGDIIAFTDDDCVVDEDWVKNIIESHNSSDVKIIGGITLNGYPKSAVCRLWQRIYVLWFNCVNILYAGKINYYEFRKENCFVKTLLTNNISYRREVFNTAVWFKPNVSMNEDAEFHYRLRDSGYRILYSPSLVVYHYYRKNIGSMLKALYVSGRGLFLIRKDKRIYNSILELELIGKCKFLLRLLYYPVYLLKKGEVCDALSILPFFIIKEIAVLCGFMVAQIESASGNKRYKLWSGK